MIGDYDSCFMTVEIYKDDEGAFGYFYLIWFPVDGRESFIFTGVVNIVSGIGPCW